MRILFLVNDTRFFLSHRLPLALAAREKGYEVHVAAAPVSGSEAIAAAGLVYHPLAFRRSALGPVGELRTLIMLYRLLRRIRPDRVHNVTIKPVLYGSLAARLTGVPVIVNAISGLGTVFLAQGTRAHLLRWFVERAYRVALNTPKCVTIFQNPDDRALFVERRMVVEERTVLIRGAGVDTRRFAPSPEPEGLPTVVLCARMLRDKGVVEFVEAAKALKSQGCQARFVLAGGLDPGNRSALTEAELRRWCADGTVEWLGHCADMPALLQGAHIACLPSYREGLPKSLLEAAACARPIVTCDVPGCREIVANEVNGLLVPPRDVPRLATALSRLIDDASLRARFGQRGRERVLDAFSLEQVVAQTLALYERVL